MNWWLFTNQISRIIFIKLSFIRLSDILYTLAFHFLIVFDIHSISVCIFKQRFIVAGSVVKLNVAVRINVIGCFGNIKLWSPFALRNQVIISLIDFWSIIIGFIFFETLSQNRLLWIFLFIQKVQSLFLNIAHATYLIIGISLISTWTREINFNIWRIIWSYSGSIATKTVISMVGLLSLCCSSFFFFPEFLIIISCPSFLTGLELGQFFEFID